MFPLLLCKSDIQIRFFFKSNILARIILLFAQFVLQVVQNVEEVQRDLIILEPRIELSII